MLRRVLRNSVEWFLPWLIGVLLIWFVVTPAESAESMTQAASYNTAEKTAQLYDLATLPRKIRKVVFRAAAYGKRDENQKAVDLLTAHLRDHPDQDHPLLQLYLAQSYADLGEDVLAAEHYRVAVGLEPRLDRGWFGLADAAYKLQDYAAAAAAFEAGYRVSPEPSAQVLSYAGTAYLMAEQPAPAFDVFAELVSGQIGSPQLKWYQGLIVAAARMEEPQRADAGVRQMLAAFQDDPKAWYLCYQHEAGQAHFREAAVALRVVGYLRPLTAAEEKQLGDIYLVAGVPYLASQCYAVAPTGERSVADYERLGSALVAAHETEQALTVLQEAIARDDAPQLWSLLGDIHYLRQEYKQAQTAFGRFADSDESGRAWLMQGYCALELGDKPGALDLLGRARSFPEQAEMAQLLMQRAMRL